MKHKDAPLFPLGLVWQWCCFTELVIIGFSPVVCFRSVTGRRVAHFCRPFLWAPMILDRRGCPYVSAGGPWALQPACIVAVTYVNRSSMGLPGGYVPYLTHVILLWPGMSVSVDLCMWVLFFLVVCKITWRECDRSLSKGVKDDTAMTAACSFHLYIQWYAFME